ncbi:hypothetical protein OCU04_009327 [Sclerotinia nivalis]|uniref:Uncharacterized protein n=1 Tax=Sclerotinia nivalis TaxID=352851 RepID=A0A9X0AIE8_9HELO|nr:hypothetical protein OCU04_009327 [Sclerotinia nivalis]
MVKKSKKRNSEIFKIIHLLSNNTSFKRSLICRSSQSTRIYSFDSSVFPSTNDSENKKFNSRNELCGDSRIDCGQRFGKVNY